MGQQKTFSLSYMRDGYTFEIIDGKKSTRPCADFQEQIATILKENPNYKMSSFTEIPNKCVNVDDGILVIEKEDPSEDVQEKRNQIIAMLYQNMEQEDAHETLKLVDELIELF